MMERRSIFIIIIIIFISGRDASGFKGSGMDAERKSGCNIGGANNGDNKKRGEKAREKEATSIAATCASVVLSNFSAARACVCRQYTHTWLSVRHDNGGCYAGCCCCCCWRCCCGATQLSPLSSWRQHEPRVHASCAVPCHSLAVPCVIDDGTPSTVRSMRTKTTAASRSICPSPCVSVCPSVCPSIVCRRGVGVM